jgi:hypothetical protein
MRTLMPLLLLASMTAAAAPAYPWLPKGAKVADTFEARFAPPEGFVRKPCGPGCAFLRGLPLKPGKPDVMLFDGRRKANQSAHLAVVEIDVGTRDLQQCADAVMRLWAESRWARGEADDLCIPLTSGAPLEWRRWRGGSRPRIDGETLSWRVASKGHTPDHASFRRYLDFAFTYAGTASMERTMVDRVPVSAIHPGDVFVQGGFPGHAVLVVDVAEGPGGRRAFALAQSYMPAQDVHVLDNPARPGQPWYQLGDDDALETPEWRFPPRALARFKARADGCP